MIMDRSFEKEYRLAVFLLKLCGLLPMVSKSKLVNWSIPFCAVTAILFHLVPEIYGLATASDQIDVSHRLSVFGLAEETAFLLLRTIVLILGRGKMSKLIDICNNLWESVANENDVAIMEPHLKQGRYMIYCYVVQCSVSVVIIFLYSIFHEAYYEIDGTVVAIKWLPLPNAIIIEDRLTYYIWYALQVPTINFVACITVTVDAVIPALVSYAIGHMKLVEFWLNDMNNRRDDTENRDDSDRQRELVKCIQHHQKVFIYCETLENALNRVMLLQICLGMSVTAIVGANILMQRGGIFSHILPLLSGAIFRLLVQCWPPDQVYSAGLAVARAIYALPWTLWSVRDRRMLLTMLMRAQKPVVLTAGKFSVMSIATFSEIMSKAMSFYAVLRAST